MTYLLETWSGGNRTSRYLDKLRSTYLWNIFVTTPQLLIAQLSEPNWSTWTFP